MWPESLLRRGAEAVFEACRRGGVTDVFLLTKGLAGKTAFLSRTAPAMEPGRDLLREALDAAHERGIRLHAWFTSASDEHYKAAHPESGLYHYVNGRDRGIVSISDPAYTAYMRGVMRELARGYVVDGVHLDYIRYNHLAYGWSDADRARYAARGVNVARVTGLLERTFYGDNPDRDYIFNCYRQGDPDALALAEARRADVTAFATALVDTVRAEKPALAVSFALMPEGAYDDLAFAALHYGQSYADLSRLANFMLPMAYSVAYQRDAAWVRSVAEGTARFGAPTLVGLHAYEGATAETLAEDIAAAKSAAGASGVCLFREGAFVWAFTAGRGATLTNPLAGPVTRVLFSAPGAQADMPVDIPQDGQQTVSLPFAPASVRAFCGEREVCVYTVGEK